MEEDRTPDLRIANATLSQLSYHPPQSGEFYRNMLCILQTKLYGV